MAGITPATAVNSTPSATASSSGAVPGSITPVEAGISGAPDKLQQLTRQIQVSGVISQLPDNGQITISTALGNLTIVLPQLAQNVEQKIEQQLLALFQSQKPLTVVVQPGNPPTQAFLMLPSSSGGGSVPVTGVSLSPANAAQAPVLPPPLVPGAILPAVVLPPVSNPAATGALLLEQPALGGESLSNPNAAVETEQIPLNTIPLAETSQPVVPPPVQPETPVSTAPVASGVIPSPVNLLPPGTELTLNIVSVSPPSLPPPVPLLPNQIVATVIDSGPDGQLLLKAGDTALYVNQSANVPVGSTLLITAEPVRAAPPAVLSLPDIGNFGALQQAVATLAQVDPVLARQVLENIIPQPNLALAGNLFLLFAAFQGGDLRSWLGPSATDILSKTGKPELIAKLTQALGEGGQVAHDATVGEWRSYPVPVYNNGQFEILNFYVHGDRQGRGRGQGDPSKPGANSMRFLIDMRLSKLGALQLDGFIRSKQLDMVIRSEAALPPGLDRELRQAYANTLSAIGYAGTLAFQTGRQHWLLIRNPAMAGNVVT